MKRVTVSECVFDRSVESVDPGVVGAYADCWRSETKRIIRKYHLLQDAVRVREEAAKAVAAAAKENKMLF